PLASPASVPTRRSSDLEVLPGRLRPSGLAVASLALPGALELLAPRVRIKPLVRHPFQVRVPVRETLGAFAHQHHVRRLLHHPARDRKSTRLNSSHVKIS